MRQTGMHRIDLARLALLGLGAAVALLVSLPSASAEPGFPAESFRRAEIHFLGAPGDLAAELRSLAAGLEGPAWVGYVVPRVPGGPGWHVHRDGEPPGCGTYYLERRDGHEERRGDSPPTSVFVLLRVSGGAVEEVRAVSTDCDVDAGGLAVYGFASVEPKESVDLLASLAGDARREMRDQALYALAIHDEPSVDGLLERAAAGELDWGRESQAIFWLGAARGERGFEALMRLAKRLDDRARHQIPFALHVSDAPGSVEALIGMARHDKSREVRRQAIFWLGQEASQKAVEELERVAVEDPDVEIEKQAIFALSQLPDGRGVPVLIRHARTHPSPAVRKQALFWLGQSGDPRALDLFEEILLQ